MTEEYSFRVPRPQREVWNAMPSALVALYPDEHIGELPMMSRHSVSVTGRRSYVVVSRLMAESEGTTVLSVRINVRPYSQYPTMQKFRQTEANRIYTTVMQVLNAT